MTNEPEGQTHAETIEGAVLSVRYFPTLRAAKTQRNRLRRAGWVVVLAPCDAGYVVRWRHATPGIKPKRTSWARPLAERHRGARR